MSYLLPGGYDNFFQIMIGYAILMGSRTFDVATCILVLIIRSTSLVDNALHINFRFLS